ncbi:MAG: hypothetical protein KGS61_09585 [Verrucomicrobia bacterium]|nr:hypothetical protein [Verrucomicrobiota bacterium]
MNLPSRRPLFALCLLAVWASRLMAQAHTLPISYLTVVPDKDYLHLELVLNPFELNFFSEIDTNHNHRLDPPELAGPGKDLTRRLVNCLVVRVDGKVVRAETAGVVPDLDSHHITLRAHYRVDARRARVAIESRLNAVTSGSHITQVRFGKPGHIQSAQLDLQSAAVTFKPFEPQTAVGPEGVVNSPRSSRR